MALLHPYQRRWIEDKSRFKIGMFARQTGKTFTTTLEIVDDCLQAEIKGERARWVILSRGERQALEAMNEGVKLHLAAYGAGYRALDYDFPGRDATVKAAEVMLPGGSKITALPANADTARGFSANVFLDEFAFHQDSRTIWKALFPVVSKPGLKLRSPRHRTASRTNSMSCFPGPMANGRGTGSISTRQWRTVCCAMWCSCAGP